MTAANRSWVVLVAGSRWDDVAGTDRRLAEALAERVEVLWLDPSHPVTGLVRRGGPRTGLHEVARGVHRLQPVTTPGGTRRGLRHLMDRSSWWQLERALSTRGIEPLATIVMTPRLRIPGRGGGVRVLFATDHWVGGATMMGLSPNWVQQTLSHNLETADVVAAVSPSLAEELSVTSGRSVNVLPNGTSTPAVPCGRPRERRAGLVGQLNERLDVGVLAELAGRRVPVLVVGPRTDRDPGVGAALDTFLAADGVEWVGAVPHDQVAGYLTRVSVGLTPYADTPFNRSSFPLKTLEYLGAGVPVVSTDLPATRWLDTDHVTVAGEPRAFADAVQRLLDEPVDAEQERSRMAFVRQHTWSARADQLLELVGSGQTQLVRERTSR